MSTFRIAPIDSSLANAVRDSLRDPIYGLPLRVEPATGYGPCRLCLRTFESGEPRILFLYNPFSADQDAEFAGPIFVHADRCEPYAATDAFPDAVAGLPIEFRAYDADGRRVAQTVPEHDDSGTALSRIFERQDVAFVHVRNIEARCFILRAERAGQPNDLTSSR